MKICEVAWWKCVVWVFVWEIVVGPHWVYGGVCNAKMGRDPVGVRFGVEKGNVAVGEMVLVESETKVVVVLNEVVSVAESENEICVHGDDVEGA